MDGCPLGLGLVVEDKPTEFSCMFQAMTLEETHLLLPSSSLEAYMYVLFTHTPC